MCTPHDDSFGKHVCLKVLSKLKSPLAVTVGPREAAIAETQAIQFQPGIPRVWNAVCKPAREQKCSGTEKPPGERIEGRPGYREKGIRIVERNSADKGLWEQLHRTPATNARADEELEEEGKCTMMILPHRCVGLGSKYESDLSLAQIESVGWLEDTRS